MFALIRYWASKIHTSVQPCLLGLCRYLRSSGSRPSLPHRTMEDPHWIHTTTQPCLLAAPMQVFEMLRIPAKKNALVLSEVIKKYGIRVQASVASGRRVWYGEGCRKGGCGERGAVKAGVGRGAVKKAGLGRGVVKAHAPHGLRLYVCVLVYHVNGRIYLVKLVW
eukprot:257627-Chlamydomonas_euryale.AAC.1